MKFTEKGLFNLKPRTERYEVWETNDHGKVCRSPPWRWRSWRGRWLMAARMSSLPREVTGPWAWLRPVRQSATI